MDNKICFFILLIFCGIAVCNIWDNIFSQLKGPQFILPEEFSLHLTNDATGKALGEIHVSCNKSIIKLVLINVNEDETYDKFINLTVNSRRSSISLHLENNCSFINNTLLRTFPVRFLLNAYDILSFYNETIEDNCMNYYVTDPFAFDENLTKEIRTAEDKDVYLKVKVDRETLELFKIQFKFRFKEIDYFISATPQVTLWNETENEEFEDMLGNDLIDEERCVEYKEDLYGLIKEVTGYLTKKEKT